MSVTERERDYFDKAWELTNPREIVEGKLTIPEVDSLKNKRVLICSCGQGYLPVQAAAEGAEVYAFDISKVAVDKAAEMAAYNKVTINVTVMDIHELTYPDNYFDVIYGSMILHHIDCALASKELYKCLKPDGIAYFYENSDRNPILRFIRQSLFGKPGGIQKHRFLFFKRGGTIDEYPLTDEEIDEFRQIFGKQNVRLLFPVFFFFQCFSNFGVRTELMRQVMQLLDRFLVFAIPSIKKYSFIQGVWMKKDA